MVAILGHHHISMFTDNAVQNNHFYTEVLGMRRVKKTVNQDDPSMYHLFYGDQVGSPGTELSFFEMKQQPTRRGTNAISHVGLLVNSHESLLFWQERFSHLGITHGQLEVINDRESLYFEDPDGLPLYLMNHQEGFIPEFWQSYHHQVIPDEHRILGMGPIVLTVRDLAVTGKMLVELLGFNLVNETPTLAVYQAVQGEAFGEIIVRQQSGQRERQGAGTIHHLALRVKDSSEMNVWAERIKSAGYRNSGIKDRFYFESFYFRDRNSILFELATDGPGFMVDSSRENLGKKLDLPPFLEVRRAEIDSHLNPLI